MQTSVMLVLILLGTASQLVAGSGPPPPLTGSIIQVTERNGWLRVETPFTWLQVPTQGVPTLIWGAPGNTRGYVLEGIDLAEYYNPTLGGYLPGLEGTPAKPGPLFLDPAFGKLIERVNASRSFRLGLEVFVKRTGGLNESVRQVQQLVQASSLDPSELRKSALRVQRAALIFLTNGFPVASNIAGVAEEVIGRVQEIVRASGNLTKGVDARSEARAVIHQNAEELGKLSTQLVREIRATQSRLDLMEIELLQVQQRLTVASAQLHRGLVSWHDLTWQREGPSLLVVPGIGVVGFSLRWTAEAREPGALRGSISLALRGYVLAVREITRIEQRTMLPGQFIVELRLPGWGWNLESVQAINGELVAQNVPAALPDVRAGGLGLGWRVTRTEVSSVGRHIATDQGTALVDPEFTSVAVAGSGLRDAIALRSADGAGTLRLPDAGLGRFLRLGLADMADPWLAYIQFEAAETGFNYQAQNHELSLFGWHPYFADSPLTVTLRAAVAASAGQAGLQVSVDREGRVVAIILEPATTAGFLGPPALPAIPVGVFLVATGLLAAALRRRRDYLR